jgi:subtilisin family serine protease
VGHEDLGQKVALAHDFVNDDNTVKDLSGHGTHVAGIAAARTGNRRGAAVEYATGEGAVVVAAAGNGDNSNRTYPAAYPGVKAAATNQDYPRTSFSNYGDWVDVAAPGVSVFSTVPGGYASWSGTSMAPPTSRPSPAFSPPRDSTGRTSGTSSSRPPWTSAPTAVTLLRLKAHERRSRRARSPS